MKLVEYIPGDSAVLLSIPHSGTYVPPAIRERFTEYALPLPDTDWHVEKLYDFAVKLKIHILFATHSRYVVDLNRDPSGEALYPGADNTTICPTTTFDRNPIYQAGEEPGTQEVKERIATYWQPYHEALREKLNAMKGRYERCVLFDAHSIRSEVPRFFDGTLAGLNLGTANGLTASADLIHRAMKALNNAEQTRSVLDGRFKGGYITRHYGQPEEGVHALQLEMAQTLYMDEAPPYDYKLKKVKKIRPVLRDVLGQCVSWAQGPPTDSLPILLGNRGSK